MELKELFGSESLDFETFEATCKAKGVKLADLSEGAYVSKEKHTKLQAEFDKYKQENDVSRYADYESIKAENESLKAEKETATQLQAVRKAGVGEDFAEFVLSKVKPLVTAEKPFDDCLKEFVTQNGQFVSKQPQGSAFVYNGGNVGGDTPKPAKTLGELLNEKSKATLH